MLHLPSLLFLGSVPTHRLVMYSSINIDLNDQFWLRPSTGDDLKRAVHGLLCMAFTVRNRGARFPQRSTSFSKCMLAFKLCPTNIPPSSQEAVLRLPTPLVP
ncbi:hypothetical protein AB6A40_001470 [Gnathostoma spinigerum]|uniref:Secreted protein n=1 Tax=Gnathostoma spinigerum TaxID=75299 RepID=A0ABD6E6I2_9BILA